ncbi:hypothetical protein [Streptomyces odonnellii]|jgi:hypothetical protein|uniref:hypothetical protein n=1 Tax=Streptomyces odonnellii TaxID=1417980 RepID=UPI000AF646BB|nr:hypothetical protein [Streptomyces odonnellii]
MSDSGTTAEGNHGTDPAIIYMYSSALLAGVVLIIFGHTTPLEASGYVSPFLVLFEQRR